MLNTLRNFVIALHRNEWGGILDMIFGLFGGGGGGGGQGVDPAIGQAMMRQVALMEQEQEYRRARQAMLDPIFQQFMQRAMLRSSTRPTFGGLPPVAPPFSALTTEEQRLPPLPAARLIGSPPPGSTPSPGQQQPPGSESEEERRRREREDRSVGIER